MGNAESSPAVARADDDLKRLKVALVTPGFSAGEDDWCIPALLHLVRELARRHDVTVYTLRYPHFRGTYRVHGATVQSFGGATAGGLRRFPLLLNAVRSIVHNGRRRPHSIVHGLWADEAGAVATLAARRQEVPALVSLMGGELVRMPDIDYGVQLSRSGRYLTRLSLRLADAVGTGSQQLLERAADSVPRCKLRRLPLGVDTTLFSPPDQRAGGPPYNILHVGSLAPVKDQATLLEAFAGVVSSPRAVEATLHVAGDGPLRPILEEQARSLEISERVQFHGEVSHERLPALCRRAHVFVLTSRYESQNLSVLEAAACGVPAVGTAVGIVRDLLPDELLAPVGNAAALTQKIVTLLEDDERRRAEGRRLCTLVRNEYSLEQTVPALGALYQELINERLDT